MHILVELILDSEVYENKEKKRVRKNGSRRRGGDMNLGEIQKELNGTWDEDMIKIHCICA